MRQTSLLSVSWLSLCFTVFADCYEPRLELGLSQRSLRKSFLGCLAPNPGCPHGALARLPRRHRPSPLPQWVGTWHMFPQHDFNAGLYFRGCRHFLDVQASEFARPPGRSDRRIFLLPQAAMAGTSTHISVCHLPEQWLSYPSESSN